MNCVDSGLPGRLGETHEEIMATIRDVARASGVSVTTVSVVLNDSPRPVHPETRQRVIAAARRLNYHPNAIARGLVRRRMNSIGVLFMSIEPQIVTNPYASGVLSGIFWEGAQQNYDIHLFTTPWEGAEISAARIRAQRTDGTLVVAPPVGSDVAAGLAGVGHPVVVLSAPTDVPGVPYVDVDNEAGARLAAEHLLSLGHTRIAHLMGAEEQYSVFQRRDAFRCALKHAGVSLPREYVPHGSYNRGKAYESVVRLLRLPKPPTALFTTNDQLAITALRAARDLGVSVPAQLSVIGFDDYPIADMTVPALTTIHHPLDKVGTLGTELLIRRIEGQAIEEMAHLFAPALVVRGTTAPPPR
jgi:LacI family transcriptional regulator